MILANQNDSPRLHIQSECTYFISNFKINGLQIHGSLIGIFTPSMRCDCLCNEQLSFPAYADRECCVYFKILLTCLCSGNTCLHAKELHLNTPTTEVPQTMRTCQCSVASEIILTPKLRPLWRNHRWSISIMGIRSIWKLDTSTLFLCRLFQNCEVLLKVNIFIFTALYWKGMAMIASTAYLYIKTNKIMVPTIQVVFIYRFSNMENIPVRIRKMWSLSAGGLYIPMIFGEGTVVQCGAERQS